MLSTLIKPKVKDDYLSDLETRWENCLNGDAEYNEACVRLLKLQETFKNKRAQLSTGNFLPNKVDSRKEAEKILRGESINVVSARELLKKLDDELYLLSEEITQQETEISQIEVPLMLKSILEHDDGFRADYDDLVNILEQTKFLLQRICLRLYKAQYEAEIKYLPARWQIGARIAERIDVRITGEGWLFQMIKQLKENLDGWNQENEKLQSRIKIEEAKKNEKS